MRLIEASCALWIQKDDNSIFIMAPHGIAYLNQIMIGHTGTWEQVFVHCSAPIMNRISPDSHS